MKINGKLRIQNKATLSALIAAVVALVYQVLGIVGVVPPISEAQVIEWVGVILNLLVTLGIIVDPTTSGIGDSDSVMMYESPRIESETVEDGGIV